MEDLNQCKNMVVDLTHRAGRMNKCWRNISETLESTKKVNRNNTKNNQYLVNLSPALNLTKFTKSYRLKSR